MASKPTRTATVDESLSAFGLGGSTAPVAPKKKSPSLFQQARGLGGTALNAISRSPIGKGIAIAADYSSRPLKAAELGGMDIASRLMGDRAKDAAPGSRVKLKTSPLDALKGKASSPDIGRELGIKDAGQYKNTAQRWGAMAFNGANDIATNPLSYGSFGVGEASEVVAQRGAAAAAKELAAKEAVSVAKAGVKDAARGTFERELARGAVGTAKDIAKDAGAVTKITSKAETNIGRKAIARRIGALGGDANEATASNVLKKGWQAASDSQLKEAGLQAGANVHGVGVVGGEGTAKVARALRAVSPAKGALAVVDGAKGTAIGEAVAKKFEKTVDGVELGKTAGAYKRLQVEDAAQLKMNAANAAKEHFESGVTDGFAKKWKGAHKTSGLVDALEGDATAIARIEKSHPGLIADARKQYDTGFTQLQKHAGGDLQPIDNYTRRVMTPEHRKYLDAQPTGGKINLMEADGKTVSATQRRLKAGDTVKVGDTTTVLKTGTTSELNAISKQTLGHEMYKTDFAGGLRAYGDQIGQAAGDRVAKERLMRSGLGNMDRQAIPGADAAKLEAKLGANEATDAAKQAGEKLAGTQGRIQGTQAMGDTLGAEGNVARGARQSSVDAANAVHVPDVAGAEAKAASTAAEASASKASLLPTNQLDQNPPMPAIPANQRELGPAVRAMPQTPDSAVVDNVMRGVKDSGGATIDVKTGQEAVQRYRFSPDKTTEAKIPLNEFSNDLVHQYRDAHAEALAQPGNHLGAWVDGDHVYLDVSRATDNLAEATAGAQAADQLAIYDAKTGQSISMPQGGAQTVGNGVPGGLDPSAGGTSDGGIPGLDRGRPQGAPGTDFPAARPDTLSGDTANQVNDRLHADLALRERTKHLEGLAHEAKVELENAKVSARPAVAQRAALLDEASTFAKQADALHAAGDHAGGDAVGLISLAREQAADLKVKRSAAFSAKANYRGLKTDQLLSDLGDAWKRHGFYDGKDFVVSSDIKGALVKMESLRGKPVGPLMEKFDRVMGLWKSYQLMTPGFHIRNYMGGLFNNWLAGADEASYRLFSRNYDRLKSGASVPDQAIRGYMDEGIKGGVFGLTGENVQQAVATQGLNDAGSALNPFSKNFVATKANTHAGDMVEDHLRGTLYLDSRIKGMSHDDAFMRVQRFHYNGQFRSEFEKNTLSRLFPFFTYTRNNMPLQWETLLADPGKYTMFKHVQDALAANPDPRTAPDNLGDFSLRAPFDIGGNAAYIKPDLQYRDLDAPLVGSAGVLNPLAYMAKQSNPFFQEGVERIFGVKLSNGRTFKDQPYLNQNVETLKRAIPPLKYLPAAGIEIGRSDSTPAGRNKRAMEKRSSLGLGLGLTINDAETAASTEKRNGRKGKGNTKTASTKDSLKAFGL